MMIDADVHLSPLKEYETNMDAEMLIKSMEESGVDKALCWGHRPYVRSMLREIQRYLYESSKRYPDKILGFGWIDPRLGRANARDELHRCLYEYGFYGVKFNGAQNEHMNDDPDMVLPLIEEPASCLWKYPLPLIPQALGFPTSRKIHSIRSGPYPLISGFLVT